MLVLTTFHWKSFASLFDPLTLHFTDNQELKAAMISAPVANTST
jgi:hypothetical protein